MARPPAQLPAVRPERPPYIVAFERFTQENPDRIEAFVAFGLFIQSELEWASRHQTWPQEEMINASYERMLHASEVGKTIGAAKGIVEQHRQQLVSEHERKLIDGRWKEMEGRIEQLVMKHSRKHFWRGVLEATVGAFFWMVLVIIVAFGAKLMGIDVIHAVTNVGH